MWNSVSSGLRRTINIRLIITVVGILLVMLLSSAETLLNLFPITFRIPFGYHVEFVKKALCSEATLAFFPILSVLPFSASYVEDLKSKFVLLYLIRGRYNTYIRSRIIACFLAGCGVVLCGVTLFYGISCNGVQREHNKKLNNGLPILHKVPPKRDYGRYFCIMAEKGGTSHGGLTEKLSPFFHAKKQEVNAYGR